MVVLHEADRHLGIVGTNPLANLRIDHSKSLISKIHEYYYKCKILGNAHDFGPDFTGLASGQSLVSRSSVGHSRQLVPWLAVE